MKITDLMLGDLVYIHEPECKGHRIDSIDELDGQVGADGEVYDECDIRPIPLTEEILAKNGFQKLNDKTFLLKNQIEIEVGPKFSEVSARYEEYDRDYNSYNNCYIEIAIIHYVHELQHLLRLWGASKEIEL